MAAGVVAQPQSRKSALWRIPNNLNPMRARRGPGRADCGIKVTSLPETTKLAERLVVFDQRIRAGACAWTEQQLAWPEGGFFFDG
jgi:hypothetical protein